MIAWLNPLALAGLVAVAAPVLIHLLRQPHAVRLPFPSLRFVQPSRTMAARMRRISDPWLLLVRVAIVTLAVLAMAQPVFVTPQRVNVWNGRVAKAIVVQHGGDGVTTELAAAAEREAASAAAATVIDVEELRDGFLSADAWLQHAPPARREVVVLSAFRHGAVPAGAFDDFGTDVGIRLVPVGDLPAEAQYTGATRFGTGAVQDVTLAGELTAVTWQKGGAEPAGVRWIGVEAAEVEVLERIVGRSGAPAGRADERLAMAFRGAELPGSVSPILAGWMLSTVLRMAADGELARAADEATGIEPGAPWFTIARGTDGTVLVRAASSGDELVIDVAAHPGAYLSAAALRAALRARHGSLARPEREVVRIPPAELARFERAAEPVGAEAAHRVERSDARWLWALVLLLLGVEGWMRKPTPARVAETTSHAA